MVSMRNKKNYYFKYPLLSRALILVSPELRTMLISSAVYSFKYSPILVLV